MSLINSSIRRVACAISGGVDSAVAALLLQRKGFDVIGVFMKNWDAQDEMGTCLSSWDDFEDAQAICESLGIELVQVSFVKEYWNDVFSSLLEDYENGMTPNPDIFCNRFIKFGALYSHAMEKIGVEAIATGHYARTSFGTFLENYRSDKNVDLLRAVDPIKDQTLFLSQVHQEALRRTMFPLGNLYKHQVRKIALENNMLKVSKKPDSTGICFIGKRNFKDFISEYIPNHRGPFVDVDTGDTVAYHNGVHHYTVGERCRISRQKTKYFVVRRDPSTQAILVASSVDHPSIYTDCVFTKVPHWISDPPRLSSSHPFYCLFRFQHSDRSIPCQIFEGCDGLRILLGAPMRAITPGQVAVVSIHFDFRLVVTTSSGKRACCQPFINSLYFWCGQHGLRALVTPHALGNLVQ
ncbi:unnamed protein product [Allacma fusca]|uniref:tRNA-5-taurinomethyluridine 2-sulfurtransferase n=1 Tax=Allacma fusca TaxID=39272 RepID=A0A8J2KKR8_9HEXA|nr:unnamed protein product [Allacma fusca]